jgi:hypothetical protein
VIALLLAYFIIEAAFLILATVVVPHPISFPNFVSHESKAKAVFVLICSIWQTLAILPVFAILYLTSLPDTRKSNVLHFRPHQISWIVILLAALLIQFAPQAIGLANETSSSQWSYISMGRFTTSSASAYGTFNAAPVIALEEVQGQTYGYQVQLSNCVAGWPKPVIFPYEGITMVYESDAACWDYQCSWQERTLVNTSAGNDSDFGLASAEWTFPLTGNATWQVFMPNAYPIGACITDCDQTLWLIGK